MSSSWSGTGALSRALSQKQIFTKALFERPQSLPELMPYDEYLDEHKVFVMKDGSLGAVFEANLVEHETLTESEVVSLVSSLKCWFTLPENCVFQILYDQAELTNRDKVFEKLLNSEPAPHPLAQRIFEEKIEAMRKACGSSSSLSPFKRRSFVSVRYFTKMPKPMGLTSFLESDEASLHSEMRNFVRHIKRFLHILKDLESQSKVALSRVGGEELVMLLRRFFNPVTFYKREFAKFNAQAPLSQQFLYCSPTLSPQGIEREGVKSRTLTLKTSPQVAYPGGMAYFTKLDFPFRLSLNVAFPSTEKVKRFFSLKEFFLQNTPSARSRVQREEILEVQDKLAREDRCLQMTFNVTVEGETDEVLETRIRRVCSVINNELDCEAISEEDIGLGLILNSLPLCYSPESDFSSQRSIRILRSDAVNFLPVFDSFRGMQKPLAVYLSRENNLVPFSLTQNETSNHSVVLADTGAGKSTVVIDLMIAAKRQSASADKQVSPLIFVLDKKNSYAMLAKYFDGEIVVFDRTQDVPFSPFRGVYDESKIAFLTKLIQTAIGLTSPSFTLESEHQAAITKALRNAYNKKSNLSGLSYFDGELKKVGARESVALTMEDVVTELGALEDFPRETLEPLILKLKPYYHDGVYAKFFRSNGEPLGSKDLYIYDLDALDNDPVLQTLMTMAVYEEIRCIMSLPQNVGRQSFLVFEEFARQGSNNKLFAEFAIDYAETMRKKGGWIVALTPRPQNYFETEIGRAFWGVADNFIFLQMLPDNVDYVKKHSSILDEASADIVRSLKTVRGQYAEIFYTNKRRSCAGAFRSWLFPTSRWMAPTNVADTKEVLNALRIYQDKWQALEYLINKEK